MGFERLAPAKVNLFLHVGPLGDDGYHPIASLMVFADSGDVVRMRRAHEMGFSIEGEFGEGLAPDTGNLVVRARDLVLETYDLADRPPFHLTLIKGLPIAAGLGGGSSDAAATLQLLDQAFGLTAKPEDATAFEAIAARLGSDVPACLKGAAVLARGRGDLLENPPVFDDLDVVLVNPGAPSPTGAVYDAYDRSGAPGSSDIATLPDVLEAPKALAAFLETCRNDLEAPAIALEPRIGEVMTCLRSEPETLLGRMSGSGATCFALCQDADRAGALAARLTAAHPDWWVRPARLNGFRP